MFEAIYECLNLTDNSIAFLHTIEQQMGIVADLSRADLLLYGRKSEDRAIVLSHARPHSLAHVYLDGREGKVVDADRRSDVIYAFTYGARQREKRSFISEGAPVVRQTYPIYFPHPYASWQKDRPEKDERRIVAVDCHQSHRV